MRITKADALQASRFITPGILFYMVLSLFLRSFGFSMSAVLFLFIVSAASAFWITNYKTLPIILGILLAMSSISFLLTIGEGAVQKYFIIFASVLFSVAMIGLYRFFAPEEERPPEEKVRFLDSGFNLNQTLVLFALFFLSSGIYGTYTIFNTPPWQMSLVMFVGIYLSGYYLIRINFLKSRELELHLDYYKNRSFNFYSLLLALAMIELVWALTFLPINHLTFGAIILAVFFSYWNIIRNYLRNELTRRKFIGAMLFAVMAVSMIIYTSKLFIN